MDSSGNNTYVVDYGNNRVQEFPSSSSACIPPVSGDWTIILSCSLSSTSTAPANVIVESNSVLTIPNGLRLIVDFTHYHLLVKSSGGVLIESGGKIG